MGYFSSIAGSAFKANPKGEGWLYYPNGIIGKGYLVVDPAYKDKLFKFQKRMYMYILPLGFLYGLALDFSNLSLSDFYLLAILLIPIYLRQYFLIRKLPKSDVKLKFKEASTAATKGLSNYYFYFIYFSAAFLIAIGLSTPLLFNKQYSEVIDLTLMLVGSGLFFLIAGFILHKLKNNN